jgi:hypothetical protein
LLHRKTKTKTKMTMKSPKLALLVVLTAMACGFAQSDEGAYPTNDASTMGTTATATTAVPMPSVDIETVPAQLMKLSELSDADPGTGVTRLIFTEKDVAGRDYVKSLMRDANLQIREDAMGRGDWVGTPHNVL